jgi:hypothetical protein
VLVGSGWPFDVPSRAQPVDSNQRAQPPPFPSWWLIVRHQDRSLAESRGRERRCAALVNHSPGGGDDEIEAGLPFGSSSCYVDLERVRLHGAPPLSPSHRQRRSSCKGAGTYLSVTSGLNSVESTASPAPPHPPPSKSVTQVGFDNEVTLIPSRLHFLDLRFLDP